MAMPNLDPRQGGACLACISSKFCSIVLGWFLVILWSLTFLIIVFSPSSVSAVVENADTTSMVIAGIVSLVCLGFSIILVIGLHKDRRLYVLAYCIYAAVLLVFLAVSFITNLFVQPQNIGFRGFISMVIDFILFLLIFFVVRSYYLMAYCNNKRNPNLGKV